MSIVSMLYNAQLLKYAGEDGVAAYGVLMYVSLVFLAVFIGYSVGTAPIISYQSRIFNFCVLLPLFGICYFWIVLFYSIEQWAYFSNNFLCENNVISSCGSSYFPTILRNRRYLALYCGGRTARCCCDNSFFEGKPKEISLLI